MYYNCGVENNFSADTSNINSSYTAALMFGYSMDINDWQIIAEAILAHEPAALQVRPDERIITALFSLKFPTAEQATEQSAQLAKDITASNIAKITLRGMGVVASQETNLIPNNEIANYRRKYGQIPVTIVKPKSPTKQPSNQELAQVIPLRSK